MSKTPVEKCRETKQRNFVRGQYYQHIQSAQMYNWYIQRSLTTACNQKK